LLRIEHQSGQRRSELIDRHIERTGDVPGGIFLCRSHINQLYGFALIQSGLEISRCNFRDGAKRQLPPFAH